MVLIVNQQQRLWLPLRCIHRQIKELMDCSGYGGWDLGVHFVDNQRIQQLNHQYRLKDRPTDILSFPFHDANGKPESFKEQALLAEDTRNLGDIFLATPYILDHCRINNERLTDHLPILFTHGLCHLMGYDHELDEDYAVMSKREKEILHKYQGSIVPF
ncbi:putative metalloprotease C21orf57-like protein [Coemansia mojavensis]|nr:putative metalloprotease C21orf57-like protein [Coemansia mojavensis]